MEDFHGLNKEYGHILTTITKTLDALAFRLKTDIFYYTTDARDFKEKEDLADEMLRRVEKAKRILTGEET